MEKTTEIFVTVPMPTPMERAIRMEAASRGWSRARLMRKITADFLDREKTDLSAPTTAKIEVAHER